MKILFVSLTLGLLSIMIWKAWPYTVAVDPLEEFFWYCPVCQGQTLFESHHPVAIEILESIQQKKTEGASLQTIKEQLQRQYGENMFRKEISPFVLPLLLGLYWIRTLWISPTKE